MHTWIFRHILPFRKECECKRTLSMYRHMMGLMLCLLAFQTVSAAASTEREDQTLASKVELRLRMEGRIQWDTLKVESDKGQVTLYGIVKSIEQRGFAEKAASTVAGVNTVVNKLIVQPSMRDSDHPPNATLKEDTRDPVIKEPPGLKDRQILP